MDTDEYFGIGRRGAAKAPASPEAGYGETVARLGRAGTRRIQSQTPVSAVRAAIVGELRQIEEN